MFLAFAVFVTFLRGEASCTWETNNTVKYGYGSTCNTPTNTGGSWLPSSECGNNFVCGYDPNVCYPNGTTPPQVCTTMSGNSLGVAKVSGYPCNTDSDCSSPFFCALLGNTSTASAVGTYYTGNANWGQAALVLNPGYAGVCVCNPPWPSALSIQGKNYVVGGLCCAQPNDCKYEVYTGATWVGGNNYQNYMCATTSGSQCATVASCHPVTHVCEQPPQAFPFF